MQQTKVNLKPCRNKGTGACGRNNLDAMNT